jgi:hypothetical protein
MYYYFEPAIIAEIRTARSRIYVLFDRWGLKYKKLSVLGAVVHFINQSYDNVTRLIALLELLEHSKTGESKYLDSSLLNNSNDYTIG